MAKSKSSLESLKWLVRSRSKIQELMLRLDSRPNVPDSRQWQLHVGAAFSLWRAVFLCHNADDFRQKLEPGAKAILRKTIEQNAINFSDDLANSAWSGGYYINNALFRLGMRTVARPTHRDQRELWEAAYDTLDSRVPKLPLTLRLQKPRQP